MREGLKFHVFDLGRFLQDLIEQSGLGEVLNFLQVGLILGSFL